jgi:hypothetical protein
VCYGGSAFGALQPGDVLLGVDGVAVAGDATVPLRDGELVHFNHLVIKHHVGERLPVTVWRSGQKVTSVIELRRPAYLVAEERYDVKPAYYTIGGLLFVPLTRDYLKTWGDSWWSSAPRELVALYEHGIPTPERQEPVVLQKVLADRVNQGYHDYENLLVVAVDGQPVRSLRHFVELVESSDAPFLRFEAANGTQVVLDRAEAIDRGPLILQKFSVPFDRSPELRSLKVVPAPARKAS